MNSFDEDAKVSFLLNGSFKAIPPSYIKLRSYFNTHSIKIARNLKLQIPKNLISRDNSCPFCFTSWSCETTSFKLVPEKKLTAKKKKLKKKKLDGDPVSDKPTNQILLRCLICRNTSTFPIFKKPKTLKVKKDVEVKDKEVTNKKKKKKKDKFSGLKVEKVAEFTKFKDTQKKENKANNFTKSVNLSSKKPEKLNNNTQKVSVATTSKTKMAKEKNKLKALRNKIVENKNSTKKTLEGFLSLVRS